MPLELKPPPSPLGWSPPPTKHQCLSTSPCTILLSEIGKCYHAFPKGTFKAHFASPAVPRSVLHHLDTHPFQWSWTTKAGLNAGKSFLVPTVPTSCPKDSPKATHWLVSIFHTFKSQLSPQVLDQSMGRVLPAFVKLYQNNMLMHLCAQCAHPRVGRVPTAPPPCVTPQLAVNTPTLNPPASLWSSVQRLQLCRRRSRPFAPYTRPPPYPPSVTTMSNSGSYPVTLVASQLYSSTLVALTLIPFS